MLFRSLEFGIIGGEIGVAVGPVHAIGRIEPMELIIVGYFFSELGEVAVEYVGHPVEAGAHVEGESVFF